ncbi:MAG: hypothetical protein KAS32_13475 [Candidatus Peribacteraceae bacterium]|nr:hypothetical protein [Candidatus Peribacteraceae bacterium]
MKLFELGNIQYLQHLASEVGEITISPDFMFTLSIDVGHYDDKGLPIRRVRVLYDGDTIVKYKFTVEGIAQGLSMLRIAQKKSTEDLRAMIIKCRGY